MCECMCVACDHFKRGVYPHPSDPPRTPPQTPPTELQHDIVPRTCVHNLAELQLELESHRDAFFAGNRVAGFLRDSGALAGAKTAAKALFNAAMAGGAARMAVRGPLGAAVMAASALAAAKIKQMHTDAVASKTPPAEAAAAAPPPPPADGDESAEAQEQRRQLLEREAAARAAAAAAGGGGGRFQMEEAEAMIPLYSPGTLLFLKRVGTGEKATHTLVQAPAKGDRFNRIIVNRSMLRCVWGGGEGGGRGLG
jgi:hypothetical protein